MLCAADMLSWFDREGILPLPCEPRSKAPLKMISSDGVYGWGQAPPDDSYHVATPERVDIIRAWWGKRDYFAQVGPHEVAMSIDCNPGYHGGRRVFGVDVDRDDLYTSVMSEPLLSTCPAVRGRKGVKLIGFVADGSRADIPGITQWYDNDPDHPALELFAVGKHLLVYGEHPASTPINRIFYEFVRGCGCPFPSIEWGGLLTCVERIARDHNLVKSTELQQTPRETVYETNQHFSGNTRSARMGIFLERICQPVNPVVHGCDIHGENPMHGSSTGKNLHVNTASQRWFCHRCGVGGGVNAWLQVLYAFEHGYRSTTLCRDVIQKVRAL